MSNSNTEPTTAPGPGGLSGEGEDDADRDEHAEEREEIREALAIATDRCLYKIDADRGGRIISAPKEQARAKWVNSLIRVLTEQRKILEARQLEDLAADVEELKEEVRR